MKTLTDTSWGRVSRLLVLVLLVALGACGGGDDDAGGDGTLIEDENNGENDGTLETADGEETDEPTSSDDDSSASIAACDVLSLTDVTAAGIPATTGPTRDEDNPNFDECGFSDDTGGEILSVSVFPPSGASGAIGDQEAIDGIGGEAFYSESFQVINVTLQDGTFVSLYLRDNSLDVRSILIELARTAFG